jgi:Tfp pilus assembly protein PilE
MRRLSTLDRRSSRRAVDGPVDERGETLIELLVAVIILSTAVLALVGGLGLAVMVSDIHRKQATAGAAVRAFAETLERRVAAPSGSNPTGYVDCATATSYAGSYPAPTGYTATVVDVWFWAGTAFAPPAGPCTSPAVDTGVQLVKLKVESSDGRASETLDVVLRKPCRLGETCT